MRLVRIAKKRWDVLAILDHRGDCQVLDTLVELRRGSSMRKAAESMLALLKEQVAAYGPPVRTPLCEPVGDDILEFRKQPKGMKLRVLWFYDERRVVVCARAFGKDTKKLPPDEKARCIQLREAYLNAKRSGDLQIEDLRRTSHGI